MSLKKIIKSKRAQSTIEYLCTAIVIAAALIAISFLPRITNSFVNTVDDVVVNNFGM